MTSRSTTLAVLGLLAGFVNVDAFRLIPAAPGAASSSLTRAQQQQSSPVASRGASTRWQTRGGLSMSTPAIGDIAATDEEVEDKPSRASVMDELDAILGDAKMVSGDERPGRVRVLLRKSHVSTLETCLFPLVCACCRVDV